MKIVLKKSVKNIGSRGDKVEVKDGYARNFLIPNDLAVVATKGAIADAAKFKAKKDKAVADLTTQESDIKNVLTDKIIEISAKAGDKGTLFAAVSAEEISSAIEKEHKFKIPADNIHLPKEIKSVGDHPASIKISSSETPLMIKITEENKE